MSSGLAKSGEVGRADVGGAGQTEQRCGSVGGAVTLHACPEPGLFEIWLAVVNLGAPDRPVARVCPLMVAIGYVVGEFGEGTNSFGEKAGDGNGRKCFISEHADRTGNGFGCAGFNQDLLDRAYLIRR